MRHVDNSGLTAPQRWAERAARELAKLYTEAKDADKELSFREMWREDAMRDRLIALIGEKCWYCETRFVRSPYHVDHCRPKSVVVGEAERRGYWWLAYDPANYRLSCHHCNSGLGKRGPARATLLADGSIMCFQRPLATPTSAARMATGDDQVDGWTFWSLTMDGKTRTLSGLRDFLLAQNG